MNRRLRRTRGTRRIRSVCECVTTHRFVASRRDSSRLGHEFRGFGHPRRLKPIAQRIRGDDKRRFRVACGQRVVVAMQLRIR